MSQGTLIPNLSEVKLICLRPKDGAIQMLLRCCRSSSACPACGTSSNRVHSRYLRKLRDLPWEKLPVVVILETRKFFCNEAACRKAIFTEQLPGTVARYSRRTFRLAEALNWITLAAGGQAGSRLAHRLGLLVSGSTLLRQMRRRIRANSTQVPRVLGIDDWAWRKGHRYGTILCDLERRRVIDLLPDREADTVVAWLKQHPGVEIISRDRGGIYAEAARRAAPQAIQVADRWHLLSNMSEALRSALESHRRTMTEVSKGSSNEAAAEVPTLPGPSHRPSIKEQNRQRRYDLYLQVRDLLDAGISQSDVARQLDVSLRTVQRWIRAGVFPERTPRHYPHSAEPYDDYLNRRLGEGCRNVTQLFRELKQRGFAGHYSSVWKWLDQNRSPKESRTKTKATASRISPRHAAWLMLKEPESAKSYLEHLYRASPEIAKLAQVAREFFRIIRHRDLQAWVPWLASTEDTPLAAFASSLLRDRQAVMAALQMPWSNGQVEGQVHRLKLIKRQMYGRASFDLLKLRVLQNA